MTSLREFLEEMIEMNKEQTLMSIYQEWHCECPDMQCRLTIQISLRTINYLRSQQNTFIVADGCKEKDKLHIIEQLNGGYALYRRINNG